MQMAILVGGMATRLGDLTRNRPKSMVSIDGTPFLEYQLDSLMKQGMENIVLCTGHMREQIEQYFGNGKKFGVNIIYSHEDKPLGTAGALKNAESLLGDEFMVLNGDSYLPMDFTRVMRQFQARDKLGLMVVYKNSNWYDKSNVIVNEGLVTAYDRKNQTPETVYIDYGLSAFRKKALEFIPAAQFVQLDELYHELIPRKELLAFEAHERFYEIGSLQGLQEFTLFIKEAKSCK